MVRSRRRPPPTPGQSPKTRPFVARTEDYCRQPCAPPHCQWPVLLIEAAERSPPAHTPCSASPTIGPHRKPLDEATTGNGPSVPALSPLACALQWLDPPSIPLRNCHCLERPSAFRPGDCANTCPASDFQGPSAPSPAEGKLALGHWHCLTLRASYIRSPLSQHGLLFNAWSPPPPPSLSFSLSLSLSLSLFILLSTSPQQPSS